MSKVRQVCSTCGSEDVVCDAYASWDFEKQKWVLHQTYDKGAHCENCEGECRIVEKEVSDAETKGPQQIPQDSA